MVVPEILDTNMTFARTNGRNHRSPHELCGQICYCLWPRNKPTLCLGIAKGSSVSWVATFNGDKVSECKLSNSWSRSYKVIKLLLSAGNCVVAKLEGDKSASQFSMELY